MVGKVKLKKKLEANTNSQSLIAEKQTIKEKIDG